MVSVGRIAKPVRTAKQSPTTKQIRAMTRGAMHGSSHILTRTPASILRQFALVPVIHSPTTLSVARLGLATQMVLTWRQTTVAVPLGSRMKGMAVTHGRPFHKPMVWVE